MTLDWTERIEYFLAKPYATEKDVMAHCTKAVAEGYRAVLLPSGLLARACEIDDGKDLKIACAIGFPFGSADADVKRYETEAAVDLGAHEIELIPNIGRLADAHYQIVLREIRDVVEAADERPVKVVIESHLWGEDELAEIAKMLMDSGAQFLTTSMALQGRHASPEAIGHLREIIGPEFGLKVAGVKALEGIDELLEAGADRVGVAG